MPSGFYLADSLLLLDAQLGGGMLVPTPEESKPQLAMREAKRIKKLVGYLRYLYRNSALMVEGLAFSCFFLASLDLSRRCWSRQPRDPAEAAPRKVPAEGLVKRE